MKKNFLKCYALMFLIIGLLIMSPKVVSAEKEINTPDYQYNCVYKFDNIPCGSCMFWDGLLTDYPPKCLTDKRCPMTASFLIQKDKTAFVLLQSNWDDSNEKKWISVTMKDPDKKCEDDGSCFENYLFDSCPTSLSIAISGHIDFTIHPLAPSFSANAYYTADRIFTGTLSAEESELGSSCEFSDSEIETSINNIRSKQEELRALLSDLENTIANKTLTNETLKEQKKKIESVENEIKDIYTNAKNNYSACQKWIDYMGSGEYDQIKGDLFNIASNLNESIKNLDNISTENKNDFGELVNDMNKEYNSGIAEGNLSGCGVLSQSMISIIRDATKILQIGVPILLIVLGTVDFAKAVIVNDQDAVKKAGSSFAKRCIAGIIIFFLPLLITIIFKMEGVKDLPGIKDMVDPLCRQQEGVK